MRPIFKESEGVLKKMNHKEYHVAKNGSDSNIGTREAPFVTIQKAADTAKAGDRVIVHEGVH